MSENKRGSKRPTLHFDAEPIEVHCDTCVFENLCGDESPCDKCFNNEFSRWTYKHPSSLELDMLMEENWILRAELENLRKNVYHMRDVIMKIKEDVHNIKRDIQYLNERERMSSVTQQQAAYYNWMRQNGDNK
jgi:hypothetical protein